MASDRKPKGNPKRSRAEAARRNGARGGRPRERPGPGGISWTVVRRYARLGADRDLIVASMGIQPDQLRDPDVIARLAEEVARGEALHRIDLLEDVQRIRNGGPGKVNAVLASLKQSLGWNKPDAGKGGEAQRPDSEAAVAEIQRMLRRFGGAR